MNGCTEGLCGKHRGGEVEVNKRKQEQRGRDDKRDREAETVPTGRKTMRDKKQMLQELERQKKKTMAGTKEDIKRLNQSSVSRVRA